VKLTDQPEFGELVDLLFKMYSFCEHNMTERSIVACGDDEKRFVLFLFQGTQKDAMAVKKFLEERDK
jgi:hypothetical protein